MQSSVALLGVIRCIRVWKLFTVIISSRVTPARLYRSRLDAAVQSSVALLGVIRCFLGHGLGRYPKNPPTSKVSSVSCEQIRVGIFFSKGVLNLFFITSLFLFFHKNYYHFTKGKEPAQSPKPAVLNLSYSQWLYLPVWLRLASPELASTQRCKARSLCLG